MPHTLQPKLCVLSIKRKREVSQGQQQIRRPSPWEKIVHFSCFSEEGAHHACRATGEAPGGSRAGQVAEGGGSLCFGFLEGVGEAGEGDLGLAGLGSFSGLQGTGSV